MRTAIRRIPDGGRVPPRPAGSRVAIVNEGQPCRKCLTPVVKKTAKAKPRGGRAYFYEYCLRCPKCGTVYMVESARREFPEEERFFL